MRMFRGKTEVILLSLCGLLASTPAHAYLDPGTSMAVIQGIIAAIAGAVVVAKLYWYRLLRLLGFKKDATPLDPAVKTSEDSAET